MYTRIRDVLTPVHNAPLLLLHRLSLHRHHFGDLYRASERQLSAIALELLITKKIRLIAIAMTLGFQVTRCLAHQQKPPLAARIWRLSDAHEGGCFSAFSSSNARDM